MSFEARVSNSIIHAELILRRWLYWVQGCTVFPQIIMRLKWHIKHVTSRYELFIGYSAVLSILLNLASITTSNLNLRPLPDLGHPVSANIYCQL